jgi:hypothetical protein
MRDYNSPRKTLEQPELKEAIKNTENDTIVGEKMSDEEFLHYYKHVKHKEKQTDVKNHEQFNPWYEFDAVAAGHDPYNIIEYVSNSCRDYIDEEKNAGSTIHEMFEALEESATINRSRRILQTPSTTVKRDAEEVIATAVAHKRTKHTEEKNGEEYIFPHIPHGGWKEMGPIPVIYSLKRKWKRYEGTITEFIKEQTGKEPEFTKDQSESTPQE